LHFEIDVFEIVTLLFFYSFFKWLFRFGVLVLIAKVLGGLKERGAGKIAEFQEQLRPKVSEENQGE
jgi:hypothetical protein